jgi:hypothetical protein
MPENIFQNMDSATYQRLHASGELFKRDDFQDQVETIKQKMMNSKPMSLEAKRLAMLEDHLESIGGPETPGANTTVRMISELQRIVGKERDLENFQASSSGLACSRTIADQRERLVAIATPEAVRKFDATVQAFYESGEWGDGNFETVCATFSELFVDARESVESDVDRQRRELEADQAAIASRQAQLDRVSEAIRPQQTEADDAPDA